MNNKLRINTFIDECYPEASFIELEEYEQKETSGELIHGRIYISKKLLPELISLLLQQYNEP